MAANIMNSHPCLDWDGSLRVNMVWLFGKADRPISSPKKPTSRRWGGGADQSRWFQSGWSLQGGPRGGGGGGGGGELLSLEKK